LKGLKTRKKKMKRNGMTEMKLTAAVITAFLILSLCSTANAGIGLGISPASLTITDAFKGGTYERTITVFNTGNETGTFGLTAEGECADWISFYKEDAPDIPITEITIPGKGKTKVLVKFDIPEDIANAGYISTIYAQSIAGEKAPTGGAVAHAVIRIPSEILIQVTGTQILKGTVKSITTADTEIDYPLKIKVEFQNEGNVIAKPKIAVGITKAGELVDSFVHDKTGIKPDEEDTITVLWNTTDRATGDYVANVAVSLGEELLATKDLPFKILPFGTLTRQGVLHSLSIEGEPLVNIVTKLVANFENTGEIDTMAKFKGEIYHDGKLLDVMESEEMFVEVGENGKITSYYKVLEPGSYAIKGRVLYAGKETEEKEVSFDVPEPEVETEQGSKSMIPGFESIMAITALMVVLFLFKVRKRRDS
jgi:hypothetical protein